MRNENSVEVGVFNVGSGQICVSDPCYKKGTWCQGVIEQVKKGLWKAQVVYSDEGDFGKRVAELIAYNAEYGVPNQDYWNREKFEAGVDSGQMSIVDLKKYHGGEDNYGDGGWYDKCCKITLAEGSAGVIDGGVVSSSGFGDGGYDCFSVRDRGKVVAIMVLFIDKKESENDSENCEE